MDIEKVKNYNQKLLAVVGTLALVFLAGTMLVTCIVFIVDNWPGGRGTGQDGLISDERTAVLQQENKRQQLVSYQLPVLVDTANLQYIVPVAVQTLDKPEEIMMLEMRSMDMSSSKYALKEYYWDNQYVNMLLFDARAGRTEQLFKQRVLIGQYTPVYFKDDILLLLFYADKDTNKDGTINQDDYRKLAIYSFKDKQMRLVSMELATVCNYGFVEDSKDLLVVIGIDKDGDGHFQSAKEQAIVKRYHYQTRELTDIVPQTMQDALQQLVEGRNTEQK